MNIRLYVVDPTKIEKIFEDYAYNAARLFDSADECFDQIYETYLVKKSEIESVLSKLDPIEEFAEEYYDKSIEDNEIKLLLMNGLYDKNRVMGLVSNENITRDFKVKIEGHLNKITENERLLFWNM